MFIKGDSNGASIEFSERDGLVKRDGSEYYRVTLREGIFETTLKVSAFDPNDDGLPKFLQSMASNWRGWDGQLKWTSLEGEFELRCEHDGLGHVATTAALLSNPSVHGWTGKIRFEIPAGELEQIANEIKRFFYD